MKTLFGAVLLVYSAFALAAPPSGKWTGDAAPNVGRTSKCNPKMGYELVAENGKLKGKLDFGTRVQAIEATVAEDGKFETSFVNPFGDPVNITGKLGDSFSVVNPKHCGWGNIPLK